VKALSVRLNETYRKANPARPIGCDAAPRRVLTHPSLPAGNRCASTRSTAAPFPLLSAELDAAFSLHTRCTHARTRRFRECAPGHRSTPCHPMRWRVFVCATLSPPCLHPTFGSGADNELGDLIVAVSDNIDAPDGRRFEVMGHLGRGTFGQVLKVRIDESIFALKIIRNRSAFRRQAEVEVELVCRASLSQARAHATDSAHAARSEKGGLRTHGTRPVASSPRSPARHWPCLHYSTGASALTSTPPLWWCPARAS
jgi:hypothetical protein